MLWHPQRLNAGGPLISRDGCEWGGNGNYWGRRGREAFDGAPWGSVKNPTGILPGSVRDVGGKEGPKDCS